MSDDIVAPLTPQALFAPGIEVLNVLGRGAFGEVVKVRRVSDGQVFAEKIYLRGTPDYNELDVLSRFKHPNLLGCVTRYLDATGTFHIALPLASRSLRKEIENHPDGMDTDLVLEYMHALLSALFFLHKNSLYHCDIKPDNILLMDDGTIKLADFGWVYPFEFDTKTTCGTPSYSSPQGWKKKPNCWTSPDYYHEKLSQIKSDIFALGCVFFEMMTGKQLIDWRSYLTQDRNNDMDLALEQAYAESEALLTSYVDKNPDEEDIFEAIQGMCALSQYDRVDSVRFILDRAPFTGSPIPGTIEVAPYVPAVTICNSHRIDTSGTKLDGVLFCYCTWLVFVSYTSLGVNNLLAWSTFVNLFYRSIPVVSNTNQLIEAYTACAYLADKCNGIFNTTAASYATNKVPADLVIRTANMVVVTNKGILRNRCLYDETDDALEIVYWLLRCCRNCADVTNIADVRADFNRIRNKAKNWPVTYIQKYKVEHIRLESSTDPSNHCRINVRYYALGQQRNIIARLNQNDTDLSVDSVK